MGVEEYEKFTTEDGLLNEFAMMWALRNKFPLHYVLFKQTACHLPREANVEQIFSRAGLLADPNLNPAHLAVLVRIGFNKKAFEPAVAAIKEKYYVELFRGAATMSCPTHGWATMTNHSKKRIKVPRRAPETLAPSQASPRPAPHLPARASPTPAASSREPWTPCSSAKV